MSAAEVLDKITIPASDRYTSIRAVEGEFIHQWVKNRGLNKTLEVGFAYGASTACIMSAHSGTHTCMDPVQEDYQNLGVSNMESLGYSDRLSFHPGYSRDVLPRLYAEQRTYDFAFIDGSHLYDGIFIDFYYVDLMLSAGGFVLFHDAWMRSTQMVASFIKSNRKDYKRIPTPVRNLILFQKTGIDERPWHHFREFYTWKAFVAYRAISWAIKRGNVLPVS